MKRNVLLVHHSNDLYGPDVVLLETVKGLDRERYSPFVVLPEDCRSEGGLAAALAALGVPYQFCPLGILRRRYLKPRRLPRFGIEFARAVGKLARLIQKRRIDIVHSNSLASCAGAVAARITGTPHIWHVHEMVVSPARVKRALHFTAPRLSSAVICISEAVKRHMLQDAARFAEKFVVVYNGLPMEKFLPASDGSAVRRELGVPLDAPLIGMVGRVNNGKGQVPFVHAAAQLAREFPGAYFVAAGSVFAGEQRYMDILQSEVENAGLRDRFLITGFRSDVPALLSAFDVFVHPAIHPEGFGLAVLEAMAAAKPVVATAHGGPLEMMEDGVSGYLVPPGDAEALARRVGDCLRDRTRSRQMGSRAQERAMRLFSVTRYLEQIEDLYEQLLKGGRPASAGAGFGGTIDLRN